MIYGNKNTLLRLRILGKMLIHLCSDPAYLLFCSGMTLKGSLVQKIGNAIMEVARNKGSTWWYTPHMAAASRAITERVPLVDILLEVRDARVCINPILHESFPLNCCRYMFD